jgi:chloramphenicol 3-O-phosphotransferase
VNDPGAILIMGVFGAGKSSVAEEMADLLEASGRSYAAIDLDWLCWSNAPGADHDEHGILARNLAAVAGNYREAGVERFVLAGSVADAVTLEAVRVARAVPVLVVRLTAPLGIIEERLSSSPTRGRADDLARAREWLAAGTGAGLEDETVENVGAIRETALRILALARWSPG